MSDKFKPAEAFSPAEYVLDELLERNWSLQDCAVRMGSHDFRLNYACLEFLLAAGSVGDKRLRLGEAVAEGLERAFGISKQTWLNLDEAWRTGPPSVPPEDVRAKMEELIEAGHC